MSDAPPGSNGAGNHHRPVAEPVPPWTLVRVADTAALAEKWAFVVHALGMEPRVMEADGRHGLLVPTPFAARAAAALDADDREAIEKAAAVPPPVPDNGPAFAGLAVATAIVTFFLAIGGRDGGDPGGWFRAGTAVSDAILRGQWWRAVTALSLHADAAHVLGNAVASVIFITALGRWTGDGIAVLLTLLAGAGGNLLTAWLRGPGHASVGASTATFAALGLLAGLQIWRFLGARTAHWFGRRRVFTIVAACLGLFAMLGVGERSDVVAHATGLGLGLVLGLCAAPAVKRQLGWIVQVVAGAATVGIVGVAWWIARV